MIQCWYSFLCRLSDSHPSGSDRVYKVLFAVMSAESIGQGPCPSASCYKCSWISWGEVVCRSELFAEKLKSKLTFSHRADPIWLFLYYCIYLLRCLWSNTSLSFSCLKNLRWVEWMKILQFLPKCFKFCVDAWESWKVWGILAFLLIVRLIDSIL